MTIVGFGALPKEMQALCCEFAGTDALNLSLQQGVLPAVQQKFALQPHIHRFPYLAKRWEMGQWLCGKRPGDLFASPA